MKAIKKIAALLVAMVLCVGMMTVPAFAASLTQDGLEITMVTDKTEYTKDEQIVAILSVKNTNDFAVTNVSLNHIVPEGYRHAEESVAVKAIAVVEAGETVSVTAIYERDVEEVTPTATPTVTPTATPTATPTPTVKTTTVKTGDDSNTALWIALMAIAVVGVAAVTALKTKKGKNIMSLFLCVAMVGATVAGTAAEVSAAERKTADISTTVAVDGSELAINGTVYYYYEVPVVDVTEGTLSGKVLKASDRTTPVANAAVVITVEGGENVTVITDSEGNYSATVATGTHSVNVSADGYMDVNANVAIEEGIVTYENFFLIEDAEDENGVASGTITNALTGEGLEGVTLQIREGWNNTEAGEVVATAATDAAGAYAVELPLGNYTAYATKDGFIATSINIVVQTGTTGNQNGSMTPVLSGDEYRIVLTWDENPRDIDSHMIGTYSDNTSFHVYFSRKNAYDGDVRICNLDVDDTSSYGPETVTLKTNTANPYYYYVHRWAGEGDLAVSGAQVKVYQGDALIASFNVPTDQGSGRYWNVFAIVNGQLVINNTVSDSTNTSYAGGSAVSTMTLMSAGKAVVEETVTEETVETPVEETTVETPVEETTVETPEVEVPVEETVEEVPAEGAQEALTETAEKAAEEAQAAAAEEEAEALAEEEQEVLTETVEEVQTEAE